MRRRFFGALLILCINSSILAAPRARSRYLMGTLLEVTAEDGADAVFAETARLDALLSTFKPDSEVSRLNRAAGSGPIAVSSDLWNVLQASSEVWSASGGAFDPSYASSPRARGFGRVALDAARHTAALPPGARLDFGGIGKGYALDAAAAVLRARGQRRALLNFGGQLLALGAWDVRAGSETVHLQDESVSGSGESERPGHIVDPATGRPVRGRASVFVILPSATLADAWSTALYVRGPGALPDRFAGRVVYAAPGE